MAQRCPLLTCINNLRFLNTTNTLAISHRLRTFLSDNAPGSFLVFYLVIDIFIICCLPYGPLSVLSGALMVQQYGQKNGILIGGICLFICTMIGGCACFALARYYFRESVQKKLDKTPKLHFLKNLDKLIEDGQGIEMVVLIRLAPLPKGPTNYFLGKRKPLFQ